VLRMFRKDNDTNRDIRHPRVGPIAFVNDTDCFPPQSPTQKR